METLGRYRLLRRLRSTEFGEIWEASYGEAGFERSVIIKRMSAREDGDDLTATFVDEARVLSQIHHDNVVQVVDFGNGDGRPYLVLERVDGLDLSALADLARTRGVSMPEAVALHVAMEIGRGLEHVHGLKSPSGEPLGIVHRDITPANILVAWSGGVRIADFGIAVFRERAERTQAGFVKGTLSYMAPEQLAGRIADARTDLFALGCLLHWMLVGRSPAEGSSTEAPRFELDDRLPEDLRAIVERATRARRSERYPNARTLGEDLWEALGRRSRQSGRAQLEDWLRRLRPDEPSRTHEPLAEPGLVPPAPRKVTMQLDVAAENQSIDEFTAPGPTVATASFSPEEPSTRESSALAPSFVDSPHSTFSGEDTTDRSMNREWGSATHPVATELRAPSDTALASRRVPAASGHPPPPTPRRRLGLEIGALALIGAVAAGTAYSLAHRSPAPTRAVAPEPPRIPAPVAVAAPSSTVAEDTDLEPIPPEPSRPTSPTKATIRRPGLAKKAERRTERVANPSRSEPEPEDAASLDRRLEKMGSQLRERAGTLPPDELRRLESRYFEARARLRPDTPPDRLREIAREIRALEESLR